jgi:hypothetical protein
MKVFSTHKSFATVTVCSVVGVALAATLLASESLAVSSDAGASRPASVQVAEGDLYLPSAGSWSEEALPQADDDSTLDYSESSSISAGPPPGSSAWCCEGPLGMCTIWVNPTGCPPGMTQVECPCNKDDPNS